MRRAPVARPRPWREFQVEDQVAFWRKSKGRGMRHGHARWHGQAVVLAPCPGSKNVRVAYRRQLFKVSQEQLRMTTITERVADDVIHQELRAIGENSAADGQVLPQNLDISRDPPPPSAEESTQTSLEERAERHERFENRSSGHVQQGSSAQSHNPENEPPSNETSSKVEESEMEKSEMPRRRIAGKRTVEEDAHVSAKKERIECTDLSLAWKHRRWTLNQKCDCKCERTGQLLTTKLTRARGRVSMSYRLFRGRLPQEKNEILKWTTKCNKRNSASVGEMNNCCPSDLHCRMTRMIYRGAICWTVSRVYRGRER